MRVQLRLTNASSDVEKFPTWELLFSGGSRGGSRGTAPLILGKKEEITEGRKTSRQLNQTPSPPPPPLPPQSELKVWIENWTFLYKGCSLKLKHLLHLGVLDCLSFSGAAAQEVVKLVTRQFVPFNNAYIYNGITGSSTTLQLWIFYFDGQTSSFNVIWNVKTQTAVE